MKEKFYLFKKLIGEEKVIDSNSVWCNSRDCCSG